MYYVKDITSNKQQNPLGRKVKKKEKKKTFQMIKVQKITEQFIKPCQLVSSKPQLDEFVCHGRKIVENLYFIKFPFPVLTTLSGKILERLFGLSLKGQKNNLQQLMVQGGMCQNPQYPHPVTVSVTDTFDAECK